MRQFMIWQLTDVEKIEEFMTAGIKMIWAYGKNSNKGKKFCS